MFKSSGDLRYGDPLSLTLFTIFIDLLSRLLNKAKVEGDIYEILCLRHETTLVVARQYVCGI